MTDKTFETYLEEAFSELEGAERELERQLHADVEQIRDHAFAGCDGLRAFRIPPKVQHIGFFTFLGCTALEEVIFHEGVQTVSGFAFMGCAALKTLRLHRHTLVETCAGDDFFYECPARIELLP